jgi:hypothetical protein
MCLDLSQGLLKSPPQPTLQLHLILSERKNTSLLGFFLASIRDLPS